MMAPTISTIAAVTRKCNKIRPSWSNRKIIEQSCFHRTSSMLLLSSITFMTLMSMTFVQSFPIAQTIQNTTTTTGASATSSSSSSPIHIVTGNSISLHRHVRQTTIKRDETTSSSGGNGESGGYEPYLQFKSILPEQVVIEENERFMLECDISGTPNPIIYWLRNGKFVQQQESNEFQDEQTLSTMLTRVHQPGQLGLSRVKSRLFLDCLTPESDSGAVYTCVAVTPYEQKRSNTKLIVVPRRSSMNDKEMEIYNNQNSIESHLHRSSIRPMVTGSSSSYHKIINHSLGTASSCLEKKSLNAPARIYFWTETTVENMGHDGLIYCRSIGYPRPTIDWFINDQLEPIESSIDSTSYDINSKYQILPSGDLLIRNVTFDDMGIYRCLAHNEFGSDSVEKIFFYPILKE